MKKSIILTIAMVFLCVGKADALIVLTAQKVELSEQDKASLDWKVRNYTVFNLNTSELLDSLRTHEYCNVRLYINEEWNWEFYLRPNDRPGAFRGKTSDNETVLLSIDENFFSGYIAGNHGDIILGETWLYTQNFTDESFIVHKAVDV